MRLALVLLLTIPALAAPPAGACAVVSPTLISPESAGLKPGPVAALLKAVRDSDTSGFAVFKDGKFVAGFGEQKPFFLYSVTKAITGMAAGRMFTEGKWTSMDAPLSSVLPESASVAAGAVTIRQWMSHTSGIRDARDENGKVLKEWNEAADWVKTALAQPVVAPPGSVYRYNNLGPTLIAAAVERSSGERMDRYLQRTVFDPLCVSKNTKWETDRAGHTAGYTGLSISAFDLAKLGQLILNKGQWGDARILSEKWIQESAFSSSQQVNKNVGLLWFLNWDPKFPLPLLVRHDGDGGQQLLIFPNHGIVVARLRKGEAGRDEHSMANLPQLAANALIKEQR